MLVTGFRANPRAQGRRRTELARGGHVGWGTRGDPRSTALPKFSWGNFPPRAATPFSWLHQHEVRGPRHPVASPSPAPRPRTGPPALSGRRRAAAAGLGPLAGYCRRIYCIAACAGCSPAHNRLAVAQGSTLRGKEGGIQADADCRAFAAVYCRSRPLAPDPPIALLQPRQRGFEGLTRPLLDSVPAPLPSVVAGMFATAAGAQAGWGTPRLFPIPVGPEALRSQMAPGCCWGHRGPPCWGATAQSWCREEAGDCKQH